MTPARARELILLVFTTDRKGVTPSMIREVRAVQRDYREPESEALFRAAGIPYPGVNAVRENPESIRLMVAAANAAELMEVPS